MPVATSENGAAVFLAEGSNEWIAHVAKHGQMIAHSTVNGRKGRWIRTSEFSPTTEKYAPAQNPPREIPPPDAAARARVADAMAALKRDLATKNLAAFERAPLTDDTQTPQGATSEERDRNAALARLKQLKTEPLPPISAAARKAARIPPKRGDDKAWTNDDDVSG